MTKDQITSVLERVRTWPKGRQAYAAKVLMLIEAQEAEPLRLSDDEWEAIHHGGLQAESAEFATDGEVTSFYRRHGV